MKTNLFKTFSTVLAFSSFISLTSLAGVSKFDSSEFNDIISENQKIETKLRGDLQKNVGIDVKSFEKRESMKADLDKLKSKEVEQYTAKSSSALKDRRSQLRGYKKQESNTRVSEEVNESSNY